MRTDRVETHTLRALACAAALVACVAGAGCKREQRQFRQAPPAVTTHDVALSDLHPGGGSPTAPVHTTAIFLPVAITLPPIAPARVRPLIGGSRSLRTRS